MGQQYSKALENEKLTDDELKKHRVGGRLVTRREIQRSKKCEFLFTAMARTQIISNSHQATGRSLR